VQPNAVPVGSVSNGRELAIRPSERRLVMMTRQNRSGTQRTAVQSGVCDAAAHEYQSDEGFQALMSPGDARSPARAGRRGQLCLVRVLSTWHTDFTNTSAADAGRNANR